MAKKRTNSLVPTERIEQAIRLIRGQKVMLDMDLAELYGVGTKVLVQAVKRNENRFPSDFMFQMSKDELEDWRSQIVTSNPGTKMGLRRPPYCFTEQGVAMLSSVLRSERAVKVNVEIMRTFVRLRTSVGVAKVSTMLLRHDRDGPELAKVVVKREGGLDTEPLHHDAAHAIGKAPALVVVALE